MPNRMNIWDEYCDWLIEKVEFNVKEYDRLVNKLHNTPFIFLLDRDEDRVDDALALRDEFFSEFGLKYGDFDRGCSVLEVLVALACRLDEEYIGDPADPHPGMIFEEMLENLGLLRYDDRRYHEDEVEEILDIWIEREFKFDGRGSPFPVLDCRGDQRNVTMWSQAMKYVSENY